MGRAPWQRHCQSHLHGARAVLVGRALCVWVGGAGEAGVSRAVAILALTWCEQ